MNDQSKRTSTLKFEGWTT